MPALQRAHHLADFHVHEAHAAFAFGHGASLRCQRGDALLDIRMRGCAFHELISLF